MNTFIVESQSEGQRLDIFLSENIKNLSRTKIKQAIVEGNVLVDSKVQDDPNYRVIAEQQISFNPLPEKPSEIVPQDIPLEIIYEDANVIVINKPYGFVMHPGAGNWEGTVANAVMGYLNKKVVDVPRAGIVHRLDKDTSGIVIIAKNDKTLDFLQKQFSNRKVEKKYLALVKGELKYPKGVIQAPIKRHPSSRKKFTIHEDGKDAITNYEQLHFYEKDSVYLLDLYPKTGRTHQLRVHLSHLGVPILGDEVYGRSVREVSKKLGIKRQMLHSYYLKIMLPTEEEKVFEIGFPQDMEEVIQKLTN